MQELYKTTGPQRVSSAGSHEERPRFPTTGVAGIDANITYNTVETEPTVMERNVGSIDSIARIVIGLVVGIAGIAVVAGYTNLGVVVGAIGIIAGAILVVTGSTNKCPVYAGLGLSTLGDRR